MGSSLRLPLVITSGRPALFQQEVVQRRVGKEHADGVEPGRHGWGERGLPRRRSRTTGRSADVSSGAPPVRLSRPALGLPAGLSPSPRAAWTPGVCGRGADDCCLAGGVHGEVKSAQSSQRQDTTFQEQRRRLIQAGRVSNRPGRRPDQTRAGDRKRYSCWSRNGSGGRRVTGTPVRMQGTGRRPACWCAPGHRAGPR